MFNIQLKSHGSGFIILQSTQSFLSLQNMEEEGTVVVLEDEGHFEYISSKLEEGFNACVHSLASDGRFPTSLVFGSVSVGAVESVSK